MNRQYRVVLSAALGEINPKAHYAQRVLTGLQQWSGADLKGKAKRYGASYARQRRIAAIAWRDSGGAIVSMKRTGKLVSAVPVGTDDYGREMLTDERGRILVATVDTR